jgi:hypothetical protein
MEGVASAVNAITPVHVNYAAVAVLYGSDSY